MAMPKNTRPVRVISSNLLDVWHYRDDQTGKEILEIKFHKNGSPTLKYRYFDVPKRIYTGLLAAQSKGRFHHVNVKWRFRFVPI